MEMLLIPSSVLWTAGFLLQSNPSNNQIRLRLLNTEQGTGTPTLCFESAEFSWVYLSAESQPFQITLNALRAAFETESRLKSLASSFSGVFAFAAIDHTTNRLLVIGDRLGIQPIYVSTFGGRLLVSTNLTELLVESRHRGEVDDVGLLQHMSFGYSVEPKKQVYADVERLPPASCMIIQGEESPHPLICGELEYSGTRQLDRETLVEASRSLYSATVSMLTSEQFGIVGLTAGKDSLCIASLLSNTPVHSGTFGHQDSSDVIQGAAIADFLAWPHQNGTLCGPDDFPKFAHEVANSSAGLATLSYVDMYAFASSLPKFATFVMGEGGECVRDFFEASTEAPFGVLADKYLTPRAYLKQSLTKKYAELLEDYPNNVLQQCVEPGYSGLVKFYRYKRMFGNFSQRHLVIASVRAKLSPFLNRDFINLTYDLAWDNFRDSALHRQIIALNNADLLRYYDRPYAGEISTQNWENRFSGDIGHVVMQMLTRYLPLNEDIFDYAGTLQLCRENIERPTRGIYYLFRVLSLSIARSNIRARAN